MSVDEQVDGDVDRVVDGELRLWEDDAGWSGYVREEIDDATVYYRVNTRFDEERWIDRTIERWVRSAAAKRGHETGDGSWGFVTPHDLRRF